MLSENEPIVHKKRQVNQIWTNQIRIIDLCECTTCNDKDMNVLFAATRNVIASAAIDEGRAFLMVSANKRWIHSIWSDGAEYTRQDFANAVPEQLEMRIFKSGGYDGLCGKDNRKKRMIRRLSG